MASKPVQTGKDVAKALALLTAGAATVETAGRTAGNWMSDDPVRRGTLGFPDTTAKALTVAATPVLAPAGAVLQHLGRNAMYGVATNPTFNKAVDKVYDSAQILNDTEKLKQNINDATQAAGASAGKGFLEGIGQSVTENWKPAAAFIGMSTLPVILYDLLKHRKKKQEQQLNEKILSALESHQVKTAADLSQVIKALANTFDKGKSFLGKHKGAATLALAAPVVGSPLISFYSPEGGYNEALKQNVEGLLRMRMPIWDPLYLHNSEKMFEDPVFDRYKATSQELGKLKENISKAVKPVVDAANKVGQPDPNATPTEPPTWLQSHKDLLTGAGVLAAPVALLAAYKYLSNGKQRELDKRKRKLLAS